MSQTSPFTPAGNAFVINTNGVASTTQQTPVTLSALGIGSSQPMQIRMLNKGTSDIWVNFSGTTAGSAVIPTAGTTTTGTPQPVLFIEPSVDLIFTLYMAWAQIPLAAGGVSPGFYMNTISVGTSQPLYCQLGEGA